jgi:Phage tail protein (Tail_P2_I)
MTQPTIAVLWVPQLGPILTTDLQTYALAIAGMWEETDQYLEDPDNDIVAFQALFDVDIAPFKTLPWLAQCVGERLPVGYDDAQSRDWIRNSPKWIRGTPAGIWNAVKRVLTPGASMQMRERWNANTNTADPDWISILTYTGQTPDPNLVLQVLRRNVPADIMYTYTTQGAATWNSFHGVINTWAQMKATYATWGAVQGATPGYVTWA